MFEDRKNGIDLPSVTELIQEVCPATFYCTPEQLEFARIDGQTNHAMISDYLDTGNTYGDEYLIAFDNFWKEHKEEFGDIVQIETRLSSEFRGFCGQPDIVCTNALIDIKRNRGDIRRHSLQLAGYNILLQEIYQLDFADKMYIIWYDTKYKKFRMKNVYDPDANFIFQEILKNHYSKIYIDNFLNHTGKPDEIKE